MVNVKTNIRGNKKKVSTRIIAKWQCYFLYNSKLNTT